MYGKIQAKDYVQMWTVNYEADEAESDTHTLKFYRQQKAQKHSYNINMESEMCVDYRLRSGKTEEECDY